MKITLLRWEPTDDRHPPLRDRRHGRHRARARTLHPGPPQRALVAVTDHLRGQCGALRGPVGRPDRLRHAGRAARGRASDVVHICTPPGPHHDQTVAAFAAGAHVVVEKPPAASLDELDDMRDAAAAAGRQLAVVFQQRTGTAAAHVRRLLQDGAFGRPLIAVCQTLWYRDEAYFAVPWRGSGIPRAGARPSATASISWICSPSCSGTGQSVAGPTLATGPRDADGGCLDSDDHVRNGVIAQVVHAVLRARRADPHRHEKATITVDHLYGHGHETGPSHPRSGLRERGGPVGPPRAGGAQRPRPLRATSRRARRALRCRRRDAPARSFEIVAAIYASADAEGAVVHTGRTWRSTPLIVRGSRAP